jgi:hypothetical protein
MHNLLKAERDAVVSALRNAYGGTVEGLFVALSRSVKIAAPEPEDGDYADDAEILNDVASNKLAAFAWDHEMLPDVGPGLAGILNTTLARLRAGPTPGRVCQRLRQ